MYSHGKYSFMKGITVIVIAHDRRKYLVEAVNSVLVQTLKKELYNIIVVKNYYDNEIDSYLQKVGVKTVFTNKVAIGAKIIEASMISDRDYISFLEDDDQYLPVKLEHIYREFERNEDIVFIHNNWESINEYGTKQNISGFTFNCDKILNSLDKKDLREILSRRYFHNLSSISIRRSLLTEKRNLETIHSSPDKTIYYLALDSKKQLLFINSKLTFFRIHKSHSMRKINDKIDIKQRINVLNEWAEDNSSLRTMLSNNDLITAIELDDFIIKLQISLLGSNKMNRTLIKRHFSGLFINLTFFYAVLYLLLGCFLLVNHNFVLWIYKFAVKCNFLK